MGLSRATLSMFIQSYARMNDYTNSKPYKINLLLLDILDDARRGKAIKEQYEELAVLYTSYNPSSSSYAFHTLRNEPNSQIAIRTLETWLQEIETDITYFAEKPDYNPFIFNDELKIAILE